MSINMRDALPRNTDVSLHLGSYVLERMWKWHRVGLRAHKAVSPLFPAGLSQPLCCCDTLTRKGGVLTVWGDHLKAVFLGEG